MVLSQKRRAVGTFANRQKAEHVLDELNNAGFSINQICVVAQDADHDNLLGGAGSGFHVGDTEEGVPTCAIAGSMLGAIGGCLVGLGILAVPGVGPIVAVGTSGTALATTLIGAGIGLASGLLTEVLADLGMTDSPARNYSDRFCQSEYLVIVDGTDDEVRRAESIFSRSCSSKVWVF